MNFYVLNNSCFLAFLNRLKKISMPATLAVIQAKGGNINYYFLVIMCGKRTNYFFSYLPNK